MTTVGDTGALWHAISQLRAPFDDGDIRRVRWLYARRGPVRFGCGAQLRPFSASDALHRCMLPADVVGGPLKDRREPLGDVVLVGAILRVPRRDTIGPLRQPEPDKAMVEIDGVTLAYDDIGSGDLGLV